ncbi:UDP-2,4-diacetamido-2,4,6-trideoxy-beta-L-altropyranose hydrolase [Paragemmobacter straminiformis]|uniref:UDP-2,4-diacetamido-2,4, 6-trideoxy-beta-L-altropyranose hydrolase n=1 Tax=Paragemmobacter straminiformis TaxID=2045119 RepID=A0A842I9N0_9RHOB|nr:UDP-2,4-diacetamido-2,4,6-trideoxy-beta-L-altropyranose hydrolase [Gemmobacter straminiformis]MBC2836301.1 UDP-2,4-diacetamido-2,4,6-trideoxy-beta-L-altropyranose hydrolase [Gemmobacter straminiformis]
MAASVAFRVDAAVHIGSGHVMRCLTLADALAARGHECNFLCRDHAGHMADAILARGHGVHLLPTRDEARRDGWLGVDPAEDAAQSLGVLERLGAGWLVVDHYALDAAWERAVAGASMRVMAIDDLADRAHVVDMLVDPMPGHDAATHAGKATAGCNLLLGPDYALLSPAFAGEREQSLARRAKPQLGRVMVAMGGYDPADVTGRVLSVLTGALPQVEVDVVLGAQAVHLDRMRARAGGPVRLHVATPHMARLLRECDLVIGAGGTSAWERCCLGVPSLMVQLADNQTEVIGSLVRQGAALALGGVDDAMEARLLAALVACADGAVLATMSAAAARVTDGRGVERVCDAMAAMALTVRRAGMGDCDAVWHWREDGDAARFYRSGKATPLAAHRDWFANALADPARLHLVVMQGDAPLGYVRLDSSEQGVAAVSLCLAPAARGRGMAAAVLWAAEQEGMRAGIARFLAEVHCDNAPSLRLFRRAGYRFAGRDGDFDRFEVRRSRMEG